MALSVSEPAADARASPARGRAAVRRRRRPALVAAAVGPGRPHADLRRSRLAAVRRRALRRGHRRSSAFWTKWCRFSKGPSLQAGEHDAFFQPTISDEHGHALRTLRAALDTSLAVGSHGLPLIGTGDWNDGMNRVGEGGKGESVWLGWFLHATLSAFAPLAEQPRRSRRAPRPGGSTPRRLQQSLEREGWDGDWYRRAYFDDGTPLGSAANSECRIDSIAQSWA